MEGKAFKFSAVFLMFLTVCVSILLPFFPKFHAMAVDAREERIAEAEFAASQQEMISLEIREHIDAIKRRQGQICLRLPQGTSGSSVRVTNDYVTRTIRIELPGTDLAYFDSYPMIGSSDNIDTMSYTRNGDEGIIELVMDRVYELDTAYDSEYYYFNFLSPHDVYDKVVVIDAGHGGKAPGATKMGVMEKDIDLAIVWQIKEIFEDNDDNIGVYFTRLDDSNPTFEQRVELANKSDADLFISIHNNSMGSGSMSEVKGTQVMYDVDSKESKRFAQICLEEMTEQLGSRDKGLVEGDSIYIVRTSEVPVALIEVGFMTNEEELVLLCSREYQREAAQGVYNAVVRAFEEGY